MAALHSARPQAARRAGGQRVAACDQRVHVSGMMDTWRRIRILILLGCGLATAPFGSLEQFDAGDGRTATLPCLSAAGTTPLPFHAPSSRADVPVRPFALPVEWFLAISQTEWQQTAAVLHAAGPRTLTYYANAPPSHLI